MSASRCCWMVSDEHCTSDAAYTIYVYDCEFCQAHGYLMCSGHRTCVEHAAGMRAGSYQWSEPLPGGNADAAMVTS